MLICMVRREEFWNGYANTHMPPEILGIQRGASKAEIKKAYHKVCAVSAVSTKRN